MALLVNERTLLKKMNSMAAEPLPQTGSVARVIPAGWVDVQIRTTGGVDFDAHACLQS
jgi:hypothetical protein